MSIPQNKSELLEAIETQFQLLNQELQEIDASQSQLLELDGHAKGSVMSIHNLVSYLIGWAVLVLKWERKQRLQQAIDFPETNFRWNQLGELAQRFYRDYETLDFPELLKIWEASKKDLIQLVTSKSKEQLYDIPFYNKYPLGRMIQLNSSSPYKNARSRIRKWKRDKQKGKKSV